MNKVLEMARLSLELLNIEKEEGSLYSRKKQVKEEMKQLQESILFETRQGKTIETVLEEEARQEGVIWVYRY